MAKNKQLAAYYKALSAKTADIIPKLYSAMAIALWRGLTMSDEDKVEAIKDIITETEFIWQQCVDEEIDILEECRELTGIEIMR